VKRINFVTLLCLVVGFLIFLFYPNGIFAAHEETMHKAPEEEVPFDIPVEEIAKYLAPMNKYTLFDSLEITSCTECHDEEWETNPERRDLDEPHDEIPGKFVNHDSENRWCLDCHSEKNRDKFRLMNGKLIGFNEYYILCSQCHKRIYREWKMGVHGKRTGYWNGKQEYMHCAQCHDPHDPPFKPIKPEPPPRKPENVRVITQGTKK